MCHETFVDDMERRDMEEMRNPRCWVCFMSIQEWEWEENDHMCAECFEAHEDENE